MVKTRTNRLWTFGHSKTWGLECWKLWYLPRLHSNVPVRKQADGGLAKARTAHKWQSLNANPSASSSTAPSAMLRPLGEGKRRPPNRPGEGQTWDRPWGLKTSTTNRTLSVMSEGPVPSLPSCVLIPELALVLNAHPHCWIPVVLYCPKPDLASALLLASPRSAHGVRSDPKFLQWGGRGTISHRHCFSLLD